MLGWRYLGVNHLLIISYCLIMMYKPYDHFVVRRPRYDYIQECSTDVLLFQKITDTNFQEAIFYASPDLFKELSKHINTGTFTKDSEDITRNDRLYGTLYRYLSRMKYRSTPFGAFSYCGLGNYSNETHIPSGNDTRLVYSLDGQLAFDLIKYMRSIIPLENQKKLKLKSNPSIHKVGETIYLWARTQSGDTKLISVRSNDFLEWVIEISKDGLEYIDIVNKIYENYELSKAQIFEFLHNLESQDILISNYNIENDIDNILAKLYDLIENTKSDLTETLKNILIRMSTSVTFNDKLNIFNNLISQLRENKIPFKENKVLQADGYLNSSTHVNKVVLKSLEEWFRIVIAYSSPAQNPLSNFIKRYQDRYEEQSISLLEAINPIVGIGYTQNYNEDSPIIRTIKSKKETTTQNLTGINVSLTKIEKMILDKMLKSVTMHECHEIILNRKDFNNSTKSDVNLNRLSISCMYKIVGYDDNGPLISHINFTGTSSTYMLTRFAEADHNIKAIVNDIAKIESNANKDVILAEISHLTNPHSWNVQKRPYMRTAILSINSFLDKSTCDIINIEDLNIYIKNGKVRLHSKKLGKEVLPCFTSAYNYKYKSSEIYKFLGDVQMQYSNRNLSISFSGLLKLLGHLPRIRYKNIIVTPETWHISTASIKKGKSIDICAFKMTLQNKNMPQYLSYSEGDQVYVVDTNSEISLTELFKLIRNRESFVLEEFLPHSPEFPHYDSVIEIIQPFIPCEL